MVREFRAMLKRRRPDGLIINASGRPRFWMLPWLARQAGIPSVWVHQMVDACDHRRLPPRRLGGRLEGLHCWRLPQMLRHRLASAAAAAVVTLNAEDRERISRWQGVRRDKIFAIPHGVDCEHFQFDPAGRERWHREWGLPAESPSRPLIVGTAGRLSREKGIDLLIEAGSLLHRSGLPVLVAIAGQGPQQEELARLAADRSIANLVKFVRFVDDMPAFYSALDIFVLCSRTESFGLALAEAMACRRPSVATPTSGAVRQISHLRSGWQLNGFQADDLAEALLAMVRDPGRCEQMGLAGRESVVRQFSIDLTLERTLQVLRGSSRRRPGPGLAGMSNLSLVGMATEDRP